MTSHSSQTPTPQSINVAQLVDGQRIGRFLIGVIVLGFLCQIGEGYDLAAAAYAAVGIAHDWHIGHSLLAPVFSASLFGMLFGAPIFGYVGDRYGRRIAIILCSLFCGITSFATAGATSLHELIVLRFLTGICLGGLPTNTISLMAEYAPARVRATLITMMFMGITFGGIVPALVTASAPGASWTLLFIVGGAMPVAAAVLSLFWLPESLKFLALRDPANPKLAILARRMRPDLTIEAGARFVITHKAGRRFSVRQLFAGKLRWITPLLWLMLITNLMTNFFLNSWMPTLLHISGLSPSQSAITASMYYVGGVVGGLIVAVALDRGRLGIVALYMVLACPAVIWLGVPGATPTMLKFAVFLVGVTVLGNQLGMNSVVGLCYPTAIRANGTGWALGMGRVGAIVGPLIGGRLIHAHLPLQLLFCAPLVPLVVGTVASLMLRPLARDRFGGSGGDDRPADDLDYSAAQSAQSIPH